MVTKKELLIWEHMYNIWTRSLTPDQDKKLHQYCKHRQKVWKKSHRTQKRKPTDLSWLNNPQTLKSK